MKLFLNPVANHIVESNIKPLPNLLDEIDAIASSIENNMNKEIKIPKDVLNSFVLKDDLNPDPYFSAGRPQRHARRSPPARR